MNSSGVLTAGQVTGNQTVTITASYTSGGTTRNGSINVTIVDSPVAKTLSSLAVTGAG